MRLLLASILAVLTAAGVYVLTESRALSARPANLAPAQAAEPRAGPRKPSASPADTVGCVRTDPPPPRDTTSRYEDIRGNPVYACRLHRDGPSARMVLRADPDHGQPVSVQVQDTAGEPVQVLALDDAAGPPFRGAGFFQGVDLNRDGWLDLKVLTTWGMTGNEAFDVFLYDPSRGRFVPDSVLTGRGMARPVAGRPCVETHWHMRGGVYAGGEHCWANGGWVLVRTEEGDFGPPGSASPERVHLHTVRELRDGEMRIVRVDTNAARH